MTVSSMGFGLSREGRERVQEQAQSQAIGEFKQRASTLAKQFRFSQAIPCVKSSVNSRDGFMRPACQRRAQCGDGCHGQNGNGRPRARRGG